MTKVDPAVASIVVVEFSELILAIDKLELLDCAGALNPKMSLHVFEEVDDTDRAEEPLPELENKDVATEELLIMLEGTDDVARTELLLLPVFENEADVPKAMALLVLKGDVLTGIPSSSVELDLSIDTEIEMGTAVEAPEGTVGNKGTDEKEGLLEQVVAAVLVEKVEATELLENGTAATAETENVNEVEVCEPLLPLLRFGVVEAPKEATAGLVNVDKPEEATFPDELNISLTIRLLPPLSEFEPSSRAVVVALLALNFKPAESLILVVAVGSTDAWDSLEPNINPGAAICSFCGAVLSSNGEGIVGVEGG